MGTRLGGSINEIFCHNLAMLGSSMKRPIVEPILKHDDNNAQFFIGILNAAWISAMLWGVGYLIYRRLGG